jgi:hypothetical protein
LTKFHFCGIVTLLVVFCIGRRTLGAGLWRLAFPQYVFPVYFVTKIDREQNYKYPQLKELYRKNGFVFLKREPPAK